MPGNKPNHKPTSKPARQLFFSEALHHKRLTPTTTSPHTSSTPTEPTTMSDKEHSTTMNRILQEITTVSHRIEVMDASITSLTLETKSMRSDNVGFQSRVTRLEQRMGSLESQANVSQETKTSSTSGVNNGHGGQKSERQHLPTWDTGKQRRHGHAGLFELHPPKIDPARLRPTARIPMGT
ncbi:hypothetical protein NDU88_002815 [Pleurodeles waltl]|uniref:Uncharacterized protein n=1 Tax=Pleurodeles waltl TaxID=8319 RepID=A0AAV7UWQ2_PLEWA|nr:hypothetical protein NDU88_002815 [Pleurodeles waltl]